MARSQMDSDKAARLAKWRRTLGVLCFAYVLMLLALRAPAGLAVAKHMWLLYLVKLQSRCTLMHPVPVTTQQSETPFKSADGGSAPSGLCWLKA